MQTRNLAIALLSMTPCALAACTAATPEDGTRPGLAVPSFEGASPPSLFAVNVPQVVGGVSVQARLALRESDRGALLDSTTLHLSSSHPRLLHAPAEIQLSKHGTATFSVETSGVDVPTTVTLKVLAAPHAGALLAIDVTLLPPWLLTYDIADLGLILQATRSRAFGVNDSGNVVGVNWHPASHATHWTLSAGPPHYGSIWSGAESWVRRVSSSGLSSGAVFHGTENGWWAAVWFRPPESDQVPMRMDFPYPGSGAFDVNDRGVATGTLDAQAALFYVDGTTPKPLGWLKKGRFSRGMGINDDGQVVGWSRTTPDPWTPPDFDARGGPHDVRPFVWIKPSKPWLPGGMIELPLVFGGHSGMATAINAAGQAVGACRVGVLETRALLWTLPTVPYRPHAPFVGLVDLGTGWANDINDRGDSVLDDGFDSYLWKNGVRRLLTDLILEDSGWGHLSAESISNSGRIAGSGRIDGETHAFVLTPRQAPLDPVPGG